VAASIFVELYAERVKPIIAQNESITRVNTDQASTSTPSTTFGMTFSLAASNAMTVQLMEQDK
jgi:hypothetical protein